MRQNFNLNKRRREEAKKKKREEKMNRRLGHKDAAASSAPFADPQSPADIQPVA